MSSFHEAIQRESPDNSTSVTHDAHWHESHRKLSLTFHSISSSDKRSKFPKIKKWFITAAEKLSLTIVALPKHKVTY